MKNGRKQRDAQRSYSRSGLVKPEHRWAEQKPCMNCGQRGAHFVPPSLGEGGFFLCESARATDNVAKSSGFR